MSSFRPLKLKRTDAIMIFGLKNVQVIPIAFALVGSLAFLCIPEFNEFLYVTEHIGTSGITRNEWVWTILCTFWVVLTHMIPKPKTACIATEKKCFNFYVVVNLLWMILPLYQCFRHCTDFSTENIVSVIGGKAAWPALWNIAIVFLPVQRISPILEAIGLSSKQALLFHIWSAYATLLWLLVHTILLSAVYIWKTESISEWFSLMLPYKLYRTEGVVNFMGWLALIFFIGICVTSRMVVQRKSYEMFRILHWVFTALFLLGSNLHDYSTWFFIQPAIIMMVIDHMLRQYSHLILEESDHPEGNVKLSTSGEIASFTFPIPNTWPQIYPGMHVYLTTKRISRFQSHPISISKMDQTKRTFTIYIKDLGDWSQELVSSVQDACHDPLSNQLSSWILEGPYGSLSLSDIVQSSKHCIFLAGGVGITGVSSLAQERCCCTRRGTETTSILWMVQKAVEANFLLPLLCDDDNNSICGNTHIWVTKESNPVAIGNSLEDNRHYPLLRTSRSSRWKHIIQLPKSIVLLSSILSSLIVLILSRFVCTSQPSKSNIPSSTDYTLLWYSATCVSCSIEDIMETNRNDNVPCCKTPIVYYGFRGLPLVLSFVLMGPLTLLLARAFNGLWFRSCGRRWFGYVSINDHPTGTSPDANDDNEEQYSGIEITSRENINFCEELPDNGSETMKVHWGGKPENSSTLFSSRYLPIELFSDDIENQRDVVVVVCGPSRLVDTTKQDLAQDPITRHWRVMVAS